MKLKLFELWNEFAILFASRGKAWFERKQIVEVCTEATGDHHTENIGIIVFPAR